MVSEKIARGSELFAQGYLAEAEALAEGVLNAAIEQEDPLAMGDAMILLGEIAYDRLDHDTARRWLNSAAQQYARASGEVSLRHRHAWACLAICVHAEDRAASEQFFHQATRDLPPPTPGLSALEVRLWTCIGMVHMSNWNDLEASRVFRQTLEVGRATEGVPPWALANLLLQLSTISNKANRGEKALEQILECLAIRKQSLGPKAPRIGMTLCKVAGDLFALQRYAEAKAYLTEGTEMLRGHEFATSARLAPFLVMMALGELERGDIRSTEALLRRCVELEQKAFGAALSQGFPLTLMVAQMLDSWGRQEETIELCLKILPHLEARKDPADEACLEATMLVLRILRDRKEYKKIISRFEARSKILHRLPTPPGPILGNIDNTLAVAYLNLRKPLEAERYARLFLRDVEAVQGLVSQQACAALSNLATILEAKGGQKEEARRLREQAQSIQEQLELGGKHLLSRGFTRGQG